MTEAMISAVKRKDVKEMVALVLEQEGKVDEAKEMREAGRLTVALIDRTCAVSVVEPYVEADTAKDDEDVVTGSIEEHESILKAIKKGKKKKALKLIDNAEKGGARGSEIKKLRTEAEGL